MLEVYAKFQIFSFARSPAIRFRAVQLLTFKQGKLKIFSKHRSCSGVNSAAKRLCKIFFNTANLQPGQCSIFISELKGAGFFPRALFDAARGHFSRLSRETRKFLQNIAHVCALITPRSDYVRFFSIPQSCSPANALSSSRSSRAPDFFCGRYSMRRYTTFSLQAGERHVFRSTLTMNSATE